MKKSRFIALLTGTVSLVLFSLGMCMSLLPQWDSFREGVILGSIGLVFGLLTLIVWCKTEHVRLPKMNKTYVFRSIYTVAAILILGIGMCLCLVWQQFVWGTLVGLLGIVLLLALIPMIKGLK